MGILALAADERVADVQVAEDLISVRLNDGRTISVPIVWYPRLLHATDAQRKNWTIIGGGYGIHWSDVDEDLSTEGLLRGAPAPRNVPRIKPVPTPRPDAQTGHELATSDRGILDFRAEGEAASTKIVELLTGLTRDTELLTRKMEDHTNKITRIAKARGSSSQYRGIALAFGADLNTYSGRVERVLPELDEAVESLEANFTSLIDYLDASDPEGVEMVSYTRSQLEALLSAVRGANESIAAFRAVILELQEKNLARDLNIATRRLLSAIAGLLASYEGMESFGLKAIFRLDDKFSPDSPS